MTRRFLTLPLFALLLVSNLADAQTIFVVRHAERTGEPDPPLNVEGQRRAVALSNLLADAGVYYFYTSDTVRARQTAEPTAARANRKVETVDQADIDGLIDRVRKTAEPARPTLVVGHRESVPRIVKALGGGDIAPLRADEHDRLIILTLLPGGVASVVTLRYGPSHDDPPRAQASLRSYGDRRQGSLKK